MELLAGPNGMIERVSRLFAKGYAAKRGNADRTRGCRKAEVAVGVYREHSDKRFGANAVNHREPLAIMGHGDICRRAWKWDGFVEHAALAIGEEDGDGLTRRIACIPNAAWTLGDPAGRIGGERRSRAGDREDVLVLVDDGKAVGAMRRGES